MISLEVAEGLKAILALRTPPAPPCRVRPGCSMKQGRATGGEGRGGPDGKSAFIKIIVSFNVSPRESPPTPSYLVFYHKWLEAPGQSRVSGKKPDF